MKKPRLTESQKMAILKQSEEGVPVADLCRDALFEVGSSPHLRGTLRIRNDPD